MSTRARITLSIDLRRQFSDDTAVVAKQAPCRGMREMDSRGEGSMRRRDGTNTTSESQAPRGKEQMRSPRNHQSLGRFLRLAFRLTVALTLWRSAYPPARVPFYLPAPLPVETFRMRGLRRQRGGEWSTCTVRRKEGCMRAGMKSDKLRISSRCLFPLLFPYVVAQLGPAVCRSWPEELKLFSNTTPPSVRPPDCDALRCLCLSFVIPFLHFTAWRQVHRD